MLLILSHDEMSSAYRKCIQNFFPCVVLCLIPEPVVRPGPVGSGDGNGNGNGNGLFVLYADDVCFCISCIVVRGNWTVVLSGSCLKIIIIFFP